MSGDRRHAWVVFTVLFFAATTAPFNQAKVPPLIPVLIEQLHLTVFEAGLLMSVFSITGMVMALPAGLLFGRFGPKVTGVFSVGCTAVGSLLGALAPTGQLLLASRLVEGVGMGMTAVLALATIAAWFPPKERGMAVGIFSAWVPLGNVAMLLIAPPLYEAFGWRVVWIVGGVSALVSLAFYAALVSLPPQPSQQLVTSGPWHIGTLNPNAWLLALAFACFHSSRVGFMTWAPTFFAIEAGFGLGAAAQLTSLNSIISIPMTLASGWLLDRVGSRRLVYTVAFLLMLPGWVLIFRAEPAWLVVMLLLNGAAAAPVVTAINTAAPETAREPRETGPAVGVVAIGRNGGQVIGPAVLAAVLQAGLGWDGVSVALVAMTVLGVIAGLFARVK